MRIAILTISDTASRDADADRSGPAIASWARERGDTVTSRQIVPDDTLDIVRAMVAVCDGDVADVLLSTGGTGFSPRDVTPEATRAVIERDASGVTDQLRYTTAADLPRAILSRGVAGIRARTLIVNLPGSLSGVHDGLRLLDPVIGHACDVIRETITSHGR